VKVDWKLPARMEHRVAKIIAQQERNGWAFNLEKAKQYLVYLDDQAETIYHEIKDMLGYYYVRKSTVNKPFRVDGSLSKQAEEYGDVGGQFTRIEWHPIELTQHEKVARRLIQLGWEPTSYTKPTERNPNGLPQLKPEGEPCPNLEKIEGGLGVQLAKYTKLTHRANQIRGWVENCRPDGRVPACANTNGTNTGRFGHKIVANVPKASPDVFFGEEMRSLFTHRDGGYILVGFDAEGLELRIAAHYINSEAFTDALVNGDKSKGTDPHTRVLAACKAHGVGSRDDAKSCVYSAVYGASANKVATTLGLPESKGKKIINEVETIFPGISTLKPKVEKASARGFLVGLDGRKIHMRRDSDGKLMKHKALNYLFQGGGAVAMKVILCYLDEYIKRDKAEVYFVGNIHDEVQAEVAKEWIDWYTESVHRAFDKAAKFLSMRCPLAAEVKVGDTWAETH